MECVKLSSGVFFRVLRGKRRRVNVAAAQLLCLLFVISQFLTPQVAQAAPSGVTVNRYFCHWHDEVSTANTTWTEIEPSTGYYPLQLTFTPPSTADYLLLHCTTLSNSSTSYTTSYRLMRNDTELCNRAYTPEEAGDYVPFCCHKVMSLTGSTEYTFKMQFMTSNAGGTAYLRDGHILVVQVSDYHYVEANTENSTISTTYVDKATLTFTPSSAGDYLVLGSCQMKMDDASYPFYTQLVHGVTSQGEVCRQPSAANEYRAYTIMRVISFDSGQQTLKIQFKTGNASGAAYIEHAHITALRLSDLGIDANTTEAEIESTNKTTTYADKATLTFTPSPDQQGDYLILGFCLLNGDKTIKKAYAQLEQDGTPHGERSFRPTATTDYIPFVILEKYRTSPGSHTFKIQFKSESTAMQVACKNARLLAIKVNTLQPYSDAGVTGCTTFTSANHTAYIYGYAYEYDYDGTPPAGMDYHIAYYDNSGAKVASVADTSNYNRSIDAAYDLTTDANAQAGAWHAVVYLDSVASPPETYTASDNNSVMEVEFTVEQSAIPEFPAVIAGVVVMGMCFGIYCWMRKMRGNQNWFLVEAF